MDLHEIPRTGGFGWLSPAQQASYDTAYLEAKEFHAARVRFLVVGVLAGRIPFCIGWFQRSGETARLEPKMDSSDLLDAIGLIDKPELLAKLAVAGLDQDAKNEALADAMDLVLAYVDKTADLLAKREAAQS